MGKVYLTFNYWSCSSQESNQFHANLDLNIENFTSQKNISSIDKTNFRDCVRKVLESSGDEVYKQSLFPEYLLTSKIIFMFLTRKPSLLLQSHFKSPTLNKYLKTTHLDMEPQLNAGHYVSFSWWFARCNVIHQRSLIAEIGGQLDLTSRSTR